MTNSKYYPRLLAVIFIALPFPGCFTTKEIPPAPDPTSIATDGRRDDGSGGRTRLLRNPLFVQDSSRPALANGIPINPICIRSGIEGARGNLQQLDPAQLVVALYPADGRKWGTPIIIRDFITAARRDLLDSRSLSMTMSSIPDGRYQVVLCSSEAACTLPTLSNLKEISDSLPSTLRAGKNRKYLFLDRDGIFGFAPYRKFIEQTLMRSPNVVGIGTNIWIEQGHVIVPTDPVSYWNGRIAPVTKTAKNSVFADPKASAPVIHLSFGPPKKGIPHGHCFPELEVLAIDLGNKGIKMSMPSRGITNDINGDGEIEAISWPETPANIAFLVTSSGSANSQKFSGLADLVSISSSSPKASPTNSGAFDRLRAFDENKDGFFDRKDRAFAQSGIWIDGNRNGKIEQTEVQALVKSRIQQISLKVAEISDGDSTGNVSLFRSVASYADTNKQSLVFSLRLAIHNGLMSP